MTVLDLMNTIATGTSFKTPASAQMLLFNSEVISVQVSFLYVQGYFLCFDQLSVMLLPFFAVLFRCFSPCSLTRLPVCKTPTHQKTKLGDLRPPIVAGSRISLSISLSTQTPRELYVWVEWQWVQALDYINMYVFPCSGIDVLPQVPVCFHQVSDTSGCIVRRYSSFLFLMHDDVQKYDTVFNAAAEERFRQPVPPATLGATVVDRVRIDAFQQGVASPDALWPSEPIKVHNFAAIIHSLSIPGAQWLSQLFTVNVAGLPGHISRVLFAIHTPNGDSMRAIQVVVTADRERKTSATLCVVFRF